jgi:hypothetical protein
VNTGGKEDGPSTGAFGLLNFITLRPVLTWNAIEAYEPFISLVFNFFFGPWILNQWIMQPACTPLN